MPEPAAALRAIIDAALAEADTGVFISSEAMHAWMATWDTPEESPPPAPDIRPQGGGREETSR